MNEPTQNILEKNILLVEDDAFNQQFMKRLIGGLGANVSCANNGKEAVDYLSNDGQDIDILLMDLDMPIMGGIEAVKIIREELNLTIPIIALTGSNQEKDREVAIHSGFNDYLIKPCDSKRLLSVINNALKLSSTSDPDPIPLNEKNDESLFSLTKLKEISRGNQAFVDRMVGMLLEEMPKSILLLKEHLSNNEYDRLRAIAHKMKPSINLMGMESIQREIQQIEDYSASVSNLDRLPQLVDKVILTCEKMLNELSKE